MKLNKDTKWYVKQGDRLRFSETEEYVVTDVYEYTNRRAVSFTIQDVRTKQTIYCYPSSNLYGAEIIQIEQNWT